MTYPLSNDDITLVRDLPPETNGGGLLLIHVRREREHFSVTGEQYATRKAYEVGNSNAVIAAGCIHEEVLAAAPELAPIVKLHLADVRTGEPMHAEANGWYRISGEDMRHELGYRAQGRKNYYNAPDPNEDPDGFLAFFDRMGANALNVEVDELFTALPALSAQRTAPTRAREVLATFELGEQFAEWVDISLRQRWLMAATQANEWINSNSNEVELPAEQTDEDEFTFEGEGGLRVEAKQDGEHWDDIGGHYEYTVTVSAPGVDPHVTKFWGSAADYSEGIVNAREAAWGILRELSNYQYESAEDVAESIGLEHEDPNYERTLNAMRESEAAWGRLEDALTANMEVIG